MSSTFSNLKFELITTGEQSGAWGSTTNTNIGTAIEQAIVGMATLTSADFTSNVLTLTLVDLNTAQNARALCLNIAAGAVSAAGTINVPAIQKPYLIINGSSYAITVKVSGQTGVSVPAGKRTVVYNNATDVGNQIDYLSTLALGTALPVTSGGTGVTTSTGTGSVVLSNSPTLVTPALGTPASGTLTNATGLPLSTGVTGTLPVANGGTGQTTAANAITALTGTQTSGYFLRSNGTNAVLAAIQAADVPTLNQNTSGTAAGLSTTLAISSGGTGSTSASGARTSLGASTVGANFFTLTDPSAVTFPRMNADNTVSALSASDFRTAIGAGSATGGTVTSVGGTGTVNGLTLTGTVTTTGNLTLGGTLSSIANSALTNSSITIGGTAISLGGSSSALANDITVNGLTVGRGSGNVASSTTIGYQALFSMTSATNNTAVGYQAGYSNTGGPGNTFLGYQSGYSLLNGGSNTLLGQYAGYEVYSGNYNTCVGRGAGPNGAANSGTGSNNVCVGYNAGTALTSGGRNTIIGAESEGLTAGSYNTYIGSFAKASGTLVSGELVITSNSGANANGKGAATGFIDPDGGPMYQGNNSASWATTSDERIKQNFAPVTNGLEVINALDPFEFDYIVSGKHEVGFKAQQYMTVLPSQVSKHSASPKEKEIVGEDEIYSINRNLDPYLVSAIKALTAKVEELTARLDAANL